MHVIFEETQNDDSACLLMNIVRFGVVNGWPKSAVRAYSMTTLVIVNDTVHVARYLSMFSNFLLPKIKQMQKMRLHVTHNFAANEE